MVLYDRRMRLAAEEVEPIMALVRLRLHELAEARQRQGARTDLTLGSNEQEVDYGKARDQAANIVDLEQAELLFRVLWRFHYSYWGRPGYPEPVTWADIEAILKNGPLLEEDG